VDGWTTGFVAVLALIDERWPINGESRDIPYLRLTLLSIAAAGFSTILLSLLCENSFLLLKSDMKLF